MFGASSFLEGMESIIRLKSKTKVYNGCPPLQVNSYDPLELWRKDDLTIRERVVAVLEQDIGMDQSVIIPVAQALWS